VAGRIGSIEKSNDLVGNRTRDFAACSIMPQPTTLPRAPDDILFYLKSLIMRVGPETQ
jgi:hypothetical protein